MKQYLEKNSLWLKVVLPPLALLIGLGLISWFGIETRVHAGETYISKIEQERVNMNTMSLIKEQEKMLERMKKRNAINRDHVVTLNQKHNIVTKDYPLE